VLVLEIALELRPRVGKAYTKQVRSEDATDSWGRLQTTNSNIIGFNILLRPRTRNRTRTKSVRRHSLRTADL